MARACIGAAIGMLMAILLLGAYGAYEGIAHVWNTRAAGLDAGLVGALFMMAYFWPIVGGAGAIIGGLAGLGSALVQQPSEPEARAKFTLRSRFRL
jgi:hypothetical protein